MGSEDSEDGRAAGPIRWLSELGRPDGDRFGGKAAKLGELIRLGVPVSPGFAIAVSEYGEHARRSGVRASLGSLLEEGDWVAAERGAEIQLSRTALDEAFATRVREAYRALGARSVAVRSSATVEDGDEASFAGQFRTLLDVEGEDRLLNAVRLCWISLWTRRALAYRHRRKMDPFSCAMGVIVQAMVPAEVSGVLFTVDPVGQRSDRMLLQAVPGWGEELVSGRAGGVVYRVDRESLRVLDIEGEGERLLPDDVGAVCRVGLRVEEHFGCPQDMEFGIRGGQVSFFQTRPITTLSPSLVDPLDLPTNPTWLERLLLPMTAEHFATAPKPLDNLVFNRMVSAAVAGLRAFGGEVLPGDAAAYEREIWRQAYRLPRHRLTWRVLLAGRRQLGLLGRDWLPWWREGPGQALKEMSQPVDVAALDDEALLRHAEAVLEKWETLLTERMYAAGPLRIRALLGFLVRLAVGGREGSRMQADLLGGLDTPTDRANLALWHLSREARSAPTLRSAVRSRAPERLDETPEGRAFQDRVRSFLGSYGHREGHSWYLSSPTWARDPEQVWGLLSSLVEADAPPVDPVEARARYRAARESALARLADVPLLRRLFLRVLETVRGLTAFREESHFDLTRPLLALQPVADEWGRRLRMLGLLDEDADVYFLTGDEVRAWLLGTPPVPGEVRSLVARRKATYRVVNTRWLGERAPAPRGGGRLQGRPASPGFAKGRARIVRGEEQFHLLREGEILVCPHTNPSWTPLFSLARAVVTEVGGPAAHAAIVAREYGIPCVMGVPGVAGLVRDGDELAVDGDEGLVYRVLREEAPSWGYLTDLIPEGSASPR